MCLCSGCWLERAVLHCAHNCVILIVLGCSFWQAFASKVEEIFDASALEKADLWVIITWDGQSFLGGKGKGLGKTDWCVFPAARDRGP